jgi:glucosylceramidase
MLSRTRRAFLQAATAAFALPLVAKSTAHAGQSEATLVWTTSKNRRFESVTPTQWTAANFGSHGKQIRVDPARRYQRILGFGAALTDASCYLISQLSSQERQALLDEFFGPSGLRFSVCRTCIGASDYSNSAYTFDDSAAPDPDLKNFSIDHDRQYILPTLRDAREMNPRLFLFSSPWSPPGWMKAGGSLFGGSMREEYFASYAKYFVKFLQDYSAAGILINAVTVQNEVDTDQNGRMPAALWGQEHEVEFVKHYLGPALQRTAPSTSIWVIDHNYDLWGRALDELSDRALYKYVDGVAWHGYAGSPQVMTKIHDAFPAKNAYWTEGGPDYTQADYTTDWTEWAGKFCEILRNRARCIVGWNLVLDENGRPNLGPFSCGGVVTANSKTHEITRSGQYWAFAHFSKLVDPDAHVIASEGDLVGISHVAFENPTGRRVVVVTNHGDRQSAALQVDSRSLELSLEPRSVTTVLI